MRRIPYKFIGGMACLMALLVSLLAPLVLPRENTSRYHQHLSAALRPEDEVDDGTFNTHLPLLMIETDGVEIPGIPLIYTEGEDAGRYIKDEDGRVLYTMAEDGAPTISGQLNVIDHSDRVNRPDDSPELISDIQIRLRGNSSREFDKKNYFIRLTTQDGQNNPLPLLGMDAHQEWALHGPFLDKSLLRNYMWYNIAGEFMDYAPNVRFCEVMLNGKYMGLYVLTEIITAGKDGARLPLTVSRKHDTFSGYLLRLDGKPSTPLPEINTFTEYTLRNRMKLEIKYPGNTNLTEQMAEAIRQDFSEFEKAIYSYDYDSVRFGYQKYIDTTSFVDYFLINELTCNYDAGWLSTYVYKGTDGRFRMCIWDFNSACDNYQKSEVDQMGFQMQNCLWYNMLFKDEHFTQEIIDRYGYLRKRYYDSEYLVRYIDDVVSYLGPAIERNFAVWGYTFEEAEDMLIPHDRNPRSYEEAIQNMKDFLSIRTNWMDENINALLQYSNESRIKKFNEKAN